MPPRQTVVNVQPGIGVAGDFASTNPRFTADFGPGGAVAGIGGCTVGLFAWANPPTDADGANATITNSGAGPVIGFIAREQQALITQYLQDAGMTIPAGFMVTVFTGGDFLVVNAGTAPAIPGQKAYANFAGGAATFAATNTPTAGGTSTASTVAPQTATLTNASVQNNVLTVPVGGWAGANIQPGSALVGTGVLAGTTVVSQQSGTPGQVGTYLLNQVNPTIAAEAMTATWGLLTIGGTVTGSYPVGGVLTGGTIAAGSTITANAANGVGLTGTGGAGTYATQTQTVASAALNMSANNVETKWFCRSYGAPGTLVKISDHPYG
jgi:hypothetical protein